MEKFSKDFINNEKENPREFSADTVTEKRTLGQGRYGEVSHVEVAKDSVTWDFAIKDYSRNGRYSEEEARKNTETAYSNYLNAKKAGLKVFPTVRISKDKPQLLVTLGSTENSILISKDSHITWDKVSSISNISSLIEQMGENVIKSANAQIELRKDSYFFTADTAEPSKVDFVVGDYERLEQTTKPKEKLFSQNMDRVRDVLVEQLATSYISFENEQDMESYSTFITKKVLEFKEKHIGDFKDEQHPAILNAIEVEKQEELMRFKSNLKTSMEDINMKAKTMLDALYERQQNRFTPLQSSEQFQAMASMIKNLQNLDQNPTATSIAKLAGDVDKISLLFSEMKLQAAGGARDSKENLEKLAYGTKSFSALVDESGRKFPIEMKDKEMEEQSKKLRVSLQRLSEESQKVWLLASKLRGALG